jgi:hypothetical protein
LAVVIGKAAKNVTEENAMDYVLGFTAANDVSSRVSQLNQSQWCFSKGFDGACPIGKIPFLIILVFLAYHLCRTGSRLSLGYLGPF